MIKLSDLIKEYLYVDEDGKLRDSDPRWAIKIDNMDDWNILSNVLDQKGFKFESGYTFSKFKINDFNPFKSERPFGDEGEDDNDNGYSYAMSYKGKDNFILISKPKKKLQMVDPQYFDSRINSTYKDYKVYNNLTDLVKSL